MGRMEKQPTHKQPGAPIPELTELQISPGSTPTPSSQASHLLTCLYSPVVASQHRHPQPSHPCLSGPGPTAGGALRGWGALAQENHQKQNLMRRWDMLHWLARGLTSTCLHATSPFYPIFLLFSRACSSSVPLDPSLSPPLFPPVNIAMLFPNTESCAYRQSPHLSSDLGRASPMDSS